MNNQLVQQIAAKAYAVYLSRSKGQLSPDDAQWITEQYLEENLNVTPTEAVHNIIEILINQE